MPNKQQYKGRILPLLSDGMGRELFMSNTEDDFSVEDLSDYIGTLLEELEIQHYGASQDLRSLMAEQVDDNAPWEGDGEVAFLLYFLHYPPVQLRQEIDAIPALKLLWDAMASVAAAPAFTQQQFANLASSLPNTSNVKCNKWGDIYGTHKYEQLDPGWAWTLKNDLLNHLPKWFGKGYGIADFQTHDWDQPFELQSSHDNQVWIAIIGDWGSGKYPLTGLANQNGPACAVMDSLAQLCPPPNYIIHLGDTYYSGTGAHRSPANEEVDNLVNILKLYPNLARNGRCFTLNSNHEMYGGAYGYYQQALTDPLFSSQQNCSYFALEFADWIIAGIDSAYFDPSVLYMQGGLGDQAKNPQYQFLSKLGVSGKKVILMSHHTGLSTDGASSSKYLWDDVTRVITPDYWYWGHIHLGAVYSANANSGSVKSRCIGHSAMPFAIPPGMANCQNTVDWYSDAPLDSTSRLQELYYSSPRAANGFAMLTLSEHGIKEDIYHIGCTTPVWSS